MKIKTIAEFTPEERSDLAQILENLEECDICGAIECENCICGDCPLDKISDSLTEIKRQLRGILNNY